MPIISAVVYVFGFCSKDLLVYRTCLREMERRPSMHDKHLTSSFSITNILVLFCPAFCPALSASAYNSPLCMLFSAAYSCMHLSCIRGSLSETAFLDPNMPWLDNSAYIFMLLNKKKGFKCSLVVWCCYSSSSFCWVSSSSVSDRTIFAKSYGRSMRENARLSISFLDPLS